MKIFRLFIIILLYTTTTHTTQIMRANFIKDVLGYDEQSLISFSGWTADNRINPLGFYKEITLAGGYPLSYGMQRWCRDYPRRAAIFQGSFYTDQAIVKTAGYGSLDINTGLTVESLATKIEKRPALAPTPHFTIIFHNPMRPEFTDVRYLQALPELKFAAFQIASTFNALEGNMGENFTAQKADPLSGPFLVKMLPGTQGENAVIGCAGAVINRKYFMAPISLLHALEPIGITINQKNGFASIDAACVTADLLQKINVKKDVQRVGIGLHKDVAVTSGYGKGTKATDTQEQLPVYVKDDGISVDTAKTQIVHQIFTAAFRAKDFPDKNAIRPLCQLLLNGSYIGTIMATVLTEQPTVILTLMGGGVFHNKIEWILEAILETIPLIMQYGLDVVLVYRPDASLNPIRTASDDAKFLKTLCVNIDPLNKTNLSKNNAFNGLIDQYTKLSYADKNHALIAQYAEKLQAFFPHRIFKKIDDEDLIKALGSLTASLQGIEKNL